MQKSLIPFTLICILFCASSCAPTREIAATIAIEEKIVEIDNTILLGLESSVIDITNLSDQIDWSNPIHVSNLAALKAIHNDIANKVAKQIKSNQKIEWVDYEHLINPLRASTSNFYNRVQAVKQRSIVYTIVKEFLEGVAVMFLREQYVDYFKEQFLIK